METNENWIFINPETYVEDEINLVLRNILKEYSNALDLDSNLSILAFSEKESTKKFFEKIIDQPVYFTNDYLKMRNFIIDWYATHKTEITKSRNITDLNLLTSEELNEFLLSLGFPYPRNIISRGNRIQFLNRLIQNYQKKGTSDTIANIVSLYGLRNVLISEWWVRFDSRRSDKKFFCRSNIVHPLESRNNPDLETEKSYEEFIKNNPHWKLSYDELSNLFFEDEQGTIQSDIYNMKQKNKVSLPSITNMISVETHSNLVELEIACAVFQRKIKESIDFWISYSLIPLDHINYPTTGIFVTSIYNDPPTEDEMEDLRYVNYYEDEFNYIFLVGSSPTGVWANKGFEKKLVAYNTNSQTWALYTPETTKYGIFTKSDSVIHKNSILLWDSDSNNWDVFTLFKKDAVFLGLDNHTLSYRKTFHWVYNGEEWINLHNNFPANKLLNRNENLFRDIPLNDFTSLYSVLEIQLAFAYLHDGPWDIQRDKNKRHLNYNGDYAPLDIGYEERHHGNPQYRNDIDTLFFSDDAYSVIANEYKNLVFDADKITETSDVVTFRHNVKNGNTPKLLQKAKQEDYKNKFTSRNIYGGIGPQYYADYNLYCQTRPEEFLKAINPTFFAEIQSLLESEDRDLILETMMVDFENYVINTMNLIQVPFAYIQKGGEFFNKKLLPVLEFFKPFRVKLLDFLTKFEIYNPLMDSQLIDDGFFTRYDELIIEKPFPRNKATSSTYMYVPDTDVKVLDYRLGHGLATDDSSVITIEHIINERTYTPLDRELLYKSNSTHNPNLDLSMKDIFNIVVTEGSTEVYNYKSDDGEITYTDSTSGLEITIDPVLESGDDPT